MSNDIPIRSKRILKVLGILSEDARMTTKRIASRMNCSQQSASYLIGRLTESGSIRTTALVDSARLGLQDVVVGLRFRRLKDVRNKLLVEALRTDPNVTLLVETRGEADILVQFSMLNLSAFNKHMRTLLGSHDGIADISFVLPTIVKREYPRSYLNRAKRDVRIVHGDRPSVELSELERIVLERLVSDARTPITRIATDSEKSASAVRAAMHRLEHDSVIRGYTVRGSIVELGISTSWVLLELAGDPRSIDAVIPALENERHVIESIKTIGSFDILVRVEGVSAHEVVRTLRSSFDVKRSMVLGADSIRKDLLMPIG